MATKEEKHEDLVALIHERYDQAASHQLDNSKDFEHNRLFYRGDQWLMLQERSWVEAPKKHWKVRLTINQLPPAVEGNISVFMRAKPIIAAVPLTDDEDDRRRANVDEQLLRGRWQSMGMESKLLSMLLWFFITGNGFLRVRWDPTEGKRVKVMEEQVSIDMMTGEPTSQMVPTGDEKPEGATVIDVIDPFSIQIEPGATELEDCAWCIVTEFCRIGELEFRYPDKEISKDSDDQTEYNRELRSLYQPTFLEHSGRKKPSDDRVAVYTMYERPRKKTPNGRMVVMVNDEIIEDVELPANGEIRIVHFKNIELPGELMAMGIVDSMKPLQYELNRSRSQLVENRNLTARPKMISPRGALQDDSVTSEPGEIIEYEPVGGGEPHYMSPPQIPAHVLPEIQWIRQDLDDVASRHEASQGKMSSQITSGKQAQAFSAADTSRYMPQLLRFEEKLEKVGYFILASDKENLTGEQMVQIVGRNLEMDVFKFEAEDLDVNCRVKMEIVSQMPWDREAMRQTVQYLYQVGAYDSERMLELMDTPTSTTIYEADTDNKHNAEIENQLLLEGVPFDPLPTDNHKIHLKHHEKAVNRPENRKLYLQNRELLKALYDHMNAHHKLIPAPQPPAPAAKLNVSLRELLQMGDPEARQIALELAKRSVGKTQTPSNPAPEGGDGGRAPGMGSEEPDNMPAPTGGFDGQVYAASDMSGDLGVNPIG